MEAHQWYGRSVDGALFGSTKFLGIKETLVRSTYAVRKAHVAGGRAGGVAATGVVVPATGRNTYMVESDAWQPGFLNAVH